MLPIISKWLNKPSNEIKTDKVKPVDTYCGLTWKQIYEDILLIA